MLSNTTQYPISPISNPGPSPSRAHFPDANANASSSSHPVGRNPGAIAISPFVRSSLLMHVVSFLLSRCSSLIRIPSRLFPHFLHHVRFAFMYPSVTKRSRTSFGRGSPGTGLNVNQYLVQWLSLILLCREGSGPSSD